MQLRMLELLAEGVTYGVVAAQVHLSESAIAYHVNRLQTLFGVKNTTALVAASIVAGLLTADQWPVQATGLLDVDLTALGSADIRLPA